MGWAFFGGLGAGLLVGWALFRQGASAIIASGGLMGGVSQQDPGSDTTGPGAQTGTGCFVRGTLIATEKGPLPIEEINLGDRIYSFAEDKPKNLLIHYVEGISSTLCKEVVVIGFETGEIRCSGRQVFFSDGNWVRAIELRPGKALLNRSGGFNLITHMSQEPNALPVFELKVNETHTYYVNHRNGGKSTREDDDGGTDTTTKPK